MILFQLISLIHDDSFLISKSLIKTTKQDGCWKQKREKVLLMEDSFNSSDSMINALQL